MTTVIFNNIDYEYILLTAEGKKALSINFTLAATFYSVKVYIKNTKKIIYIHTKV